MFISFYRRFISSFVSDFEVVFLNVVCDREHIAWLFTNGVTKLFALVNILKMFRLKFLVDLEKVIFEVTKCIWLKVGKVSYVVFIIKLVAKAQSV